MKMQIRNMILALLVTVPLTFTLVFFGYLPLHYDIVLSVDNVEGEGICQSYGSQIDGRTSVNQVTFYFGSELETATIKGFYYDVDTLYLVTSDVNRFDIRGIDSYIHGIHLDRFTANDILPEGEVIEGTHATMSSKNGALHVVVNDPDEGTTVTISKPFIPLWFVVIYFSVILAISVLLAIVLAYLYSAFPRLMLPLTGAAGIAITVITGSFFCGSLAYLTYVNFLLNWLFLFAWSMIMNAVTLPYLGTILTMTLTTIWYIADYFVIILRGKPIMPADLKAIGTATEVMGGYTFIPSWKMVAGVIFVACYAAVIIYMWKSSKPAETRNLREQMLERAATAGLAIILVIAGINNSAFKNLNTFAWDSVLMKSFHEEGMVLSFIKSALNSDVSVPEGFSSEVVQSYLAEYETASSMDEAAVHPTRVLMVMGEAFADLRGVGLDPRIDVMPFIDNLDENVVQGNLYVSVFGGGTCNTEFEALTGNTLAFLGASAYPYTEYVTKPLFSLASYFKAIGYNVEAFHPNEVTNWNRNMAYPNMGFEEFHGIEDFESSLGDLVYLHDQPADINDYRYIEKVDKDESSEPRFLFDVTMQNHSPYERWLDVEKAATVQEYGSDLYVDTQVYLSLIKASDDELKQLIETYKSSDEPTMIVFFGDHQPGLPSMSINEIYTNIQNNLDLYKSKFFIWTNYDTQEWHNAGLSANYLPWLILERGNFPLPPYVQMLKELYAAYPIISSQGVVDIDGNVYDSISEVMDDPLIQKYQYIQYANLFDELDSAWFITR